MVRMQRKIHQLKLSAPPVSPMPNLQRINTKCDLIECDEDDDPIVVEACNEVLQKHNEQKTYDVEQEVEQEIKQKISDYSTSSSESSGSEYSSDSEDEYDPNKTIYITKKILTCKHCGHGITKSINKTIVRH